MLMSFSVQRKALDETKAIFPQMKSKIDEAKSKLEAQLVSMFTVIQNKFRSVKPPDACNCRSSCNVLISGLCRRRTRVRAIKARQKMSPRQKKPYLRP